MKRINYILVTVLLALIAMVLVACGSEGKSEQAKTAKTARVIMTTSEILAALQPGQWVELEADIQSDHSISCGEVEILTGDFMDGDWEMNGIVESVDRDSQHFVLNGMTIKFRSDTEFDSEDGEFNSFADVQVGQLLEVEGTYLKDGSFMATEIEDESIKLDLEPELRTHFECTGRLDEVDVAGKTLTMMGMRFKLTEDAEGKSVAK